MDAKFGSSPHTWGILIIQPTAVPPQRFIPTYVGHTASRTQSFHNIRFIPTYVGHTHSHGLTG